MYLQGRQYYGRPGELRTNLKAAEQLFGWPCTRIRVRPRSRGALDRARHVYWLRYDPSPARAARQPEEAEEAVRLAPDLPETHVALGLARYDARLDYVGALTELTIARKGLPKDADLWQVIGYVNRRLGRWDEPSAAYDNAIASIPGAPTCSTTWAANLHPAAPLRGRRRRLRPGPERSRPTCTRPRIAALLPTSSGRGASSRCATSCSHLPEGADARRQRHRGGPACRAGCCSSATPPACCSCPTLGRATDFEASTLLPAQSRSTEGGPTRCAATPPSAREAFSAAVTRLDARGS